MGEAERRRRRVAAGAIGESQRYVRRYPQYEACAHRALIRLCTPGRFPTPPLAGSAAVRRESDQPDVDEIRVMQPRVQLGQLRLSHGQGVAAGGRHKRIAAVHRQLRLTQPIGADHSTAQSTRATKTSGCTLSSHPRPAQAATAATAAPARDGARKRSRAQSAGRVTDRAGLGVAA